MLNHLVFNENMTSWLLFFFHMANWKMRLFDLYFNYTPSDLSPLHFLSNMNLESKHTLIFPISPASRMATKKVVFFTFLWFTCVLRRFRANSFPACCRAREGLPLRGETAWLCNHPWSAAAPRRPAFSMSLQLSWKRSYFMSHFMLQALLLWDSFAQMLETSFKKKTHKTTKCFTFSLKRREGVTSPRNRDFYQTDPAQFMTGCCLLSRAWCL